MSTFANNITESCRILEKDYIDIILMIKGIRRYIYFINLNEISARGRVLISTQPIRSNVANNDIIVF